MQSHVHSVFREIICTEDTKHITDQNGNDFSNDEACVDDVGNLLQK